MASLTSVPQEIVFQIVKYLVNDFKSILSFEATCKSTRIHFHNNYGKIFQIVFPSKSTTALLEAPTVKPVFFNKLSSTEIESLLWKKKFVKLQSYTVERYNQLYGISSAGRDFKKGTRYQQFQKKVADCRFSQQLKSSEIKVAITGSSGVGKTSFTMNFVEGIFLEEYEPTIDDRDRRVVDVDGQKYAVEVMDLSGQEEYRALRNQFYRTCEAFIVMFSVTDKKTIDDALEQVDQIRNIREQSFEDIPILFVGNKIDLISQGITYGMTELKEQWSTKFTTSVNSIQYIEASALFAENVDEAFEKLVRIAREKQPQETSTKKHKKQCTVN